MGKTFAAVALLLLAIGIGFAGYREQVEIRVLNQDNLPVPGAYVDITYEISHNKPLFTTAKKMTNERGRVNFDFSNSEYNANDTNKTYTVHAYFGDSTGSARFNASYGEYPRTVRVVAYSLRAHVTDRNAVPISVPVTVWELNGTSDQYGDVLFMVPPGNHTISAFYRGVERMQNFLVSDNMYQEVVVRLYNLTVRVVDDSGKPISAEVYVGPQQKTADADGYAFFDDILESEPPISVYYARFKKVVPSNLAADNNMLIFFDTNPPYISDIEAQWKDRFLQVSAVINENTTYASGMRSGNASVNLIYMTVGGTDRTVPMYAVGYNFYEGLIPVTGTESQIKYSIVATDGDGNKRTSTDTFVLPTNIDRPRERDEPPRETTSAGADTSMLAIVGIGIIVIVVGVTFYYTKDHIFPKTGAPGGLQPPLPPIPPKKP